MKRKKQFLTAMLCAFSLLGNSAAAFAQSQDKRKEPKSNTKQAPEPSGDVFWVAGEPGQEPTFEVPLPPPQLSIAHFDGAPQVEFMHNEFNFDGKLVKDAPYSADAVTETVQTLGDGNRIVHSSPAKIYRDSAGRTRREQSVSAVGPWSVSGEAAKMIFINDPVASVNYNLNPDTKTANKMTMHRMSVSGGGISTYSVSGVSTNVSVKGEGSGQVKFTSDDNNVIMLSGVPAEKVAAELKATKTATVESQSSDGQKTIEVFRPGRGVGVISGVASSGGNMMSFAGEAEVNRESLGKQTIEGVEAEGSRVTFTIPAGKIGNDRPIVTVNEQWYSPELQAIVMSKNSDPRMGETIYRLTNIVRSEPDPSLFQVPADYTVKENGFGFRTGAAEPLRRIEMEKKAKKPEDN